MPSPTDPADADKHPAVSLCRELIQRPSLTPDDAGCQALIAKRLEAQGFVIEHLRHGEVENLWARRGDTGPLFVFAGHTDVVPTGDVSQWRHPPFAAVVDDGRLYGRGAADMKGSVAAMVVAVERFLAGRTAHLGSIALLLTSDEEGPAVDGTRHVVETLRARGEQIDWCLLGEPSSTQRFGDTMRLGRRGSLSCSLSVTGVQGHVAYPQLADNPIHRLAPFLAELVSIEWDQGNAHFPPTTLQISNIHAGTGALNVIPQSVQVDFNLRYAPVSTIESLRQGIEELVRQHQLNAQLEWFDSARPFMAPPGTLAETLGDIIEQQFQLRPVGDTGGGTSDGRFIIDLATELIEFGPSNATIHQIDEHIRLDELIATCQVYEYLLHRLLGDRQS